MSDVALSTVFANQRRKIYTITASNAAFPIPSWAQGGMMYVTGCGGGGSGAVRATSGSRGSGGSSAASVLRLPMILPAGVTTLNIEIGAGGTGPSATAQTDGAAGGNTTLTVGSTIALTIGGGVAGLGSGSAGSVAAIASTVNQQANVTTGTMYPNATGAYAATQVYWIGANAGGTGTSPAAGYGAGASSLFGLGGAGLSAGPTANTAGADANGYGAGGAGALWLSGGAVKAGNGSPGFLQIEFVEGF